MIDTAEIFAKQFTPYGGDYLYYPSKRSGGKVVSEAEFQALRTRWLAVVGRRWAWKTAGLIILSVILVHLAEALSGLDALIGNIVIGISVVAVMCMVLWAASAPARLVKDRPEVVPPSSPADSKRAMRDALPWGKVIFACLFGMAIFKITLSHHPNSIGEWLQLAGSGVTCALFLWIGVQKFRDRKRG